MEQVSESDAPLCARYSLPAQVSRNLSDVSWEMVIQLSSDYQTKSEDKSSNAKKVIKEIQMTRLLLLERIREGSKGGAIDPKLLVDVVKLLQRCEEVAGQYDLDLKEFSNFLYLITEKLKKEKLARHDGIAGIGKIIPMKEELSRMKSRSERQTPEKRKQRRRRGR